ncbi:MAG: NAD(P)H-dependent oxidoreductase subunit E [Hahellaceae bacterium]|nr:NAD(P)H-dependent oxidoreductase subunit E [Hahellaceae bacterium]
MDNTDSVAVKEACARFDFDPKRLLDILWQVQDVNRCVDANALTDIAQATGLPRVSVDGVASFYHFYSSRPKGRFAIYLCDDIVDRQHGFNDLLAVLRDELGIAPGQITADGLFSVDLTPCIGLCDQPPGLLVNQYIAGSLTPAKLRRLLQDLKKDSHPGSSFTQGGEGQNGNSLIQTRLKNNIRRRGAILGSGQLTESGLQNASELSSFEILETLRASGLRGRGGAGYPVWQKLDTAFRQITADKVVICNADEGEPGTFKDRVLLTEQPDLVFEGMTIAARATGASQGILYLRAEYRYLEAWLEERLAQRRAEGLLGSHICGTEGFNFDIRIQRGAGAYICGEESALIRSCEGGRGEPTSRPPYPAIQGYKGLPTTVNNVETFCCIARIFEIGATAFARLGTPQSTGTKLFSVSGDCRKPGVYEFPFGLTVRELLNHCQADDAAAVVVGGPSGQIIGRNEFDRRLCFEDLATAGAFVVFNSTRNILEIVRAYIQFFVDESCGYCTPCRVGNVFLLERMDKIIAGKGETTDIDYLRQLADTIIETSRCGLGHTSPRPILSTLANFPLVYAALLKAPNAGSQPGFDIQKALDEARHLAHRGSTLYDRDYSGGVS